MRIRLSAAILLVACFCGGREDRDPMIAASGVTPPPGQLARTIFGLIPKESRCGEVFQRQPDGRAALAVLGAGFRHGDVIHWMGQPLPTTYGNSRILTASLAPALLARDGEVAVTVESSVDPALPLRARFRVHPPCINAPPPAAR